MTIVKIDALSSNIAWPLNQSVQQANGAQFALMLSLMMEAQPAVNDVSLLPQPAQLKQARQPDSQFNLELSQTKALQQRHMQHFHFLLSLYEEQIIVDQREQQHTNDNLVDSDQVLQAMQAASPV